MLRIDGRVLAASVLGVFLVGAVLGFAVGGGSGQSDAPGEVGPATSTPAPVVTPTPSPTAAPDGTGTPSGTPIATGTVAETGTDEGTVTDAGAGTATSTAVPTPTATTRPTVTPTRTPMLIRRFDTAEIERELRDLIDDWREERGLRPFTNSDGRVVAKLDRMATAHSVDMADLGETVHRVDNRSSAGRYRDAELFETCQFKKDGAQYVVTPTRNRLEVVGKTYAGRTYRGPDGTRYNENETAVARAIFDSWTEAKPFSDRLSYANATRIGIGIETTEDNEVYVTGNLCGLYGSG